jgi:hypothetical protein
LRLQAVLTPTESKKLIAKAILLRDEMKKALSEDIVVIHPSSTTVFILEELGITRPTSMWICGLIQPRGLCASGQILDESRRAVFEPTKYAHSWMLEKGSLVPKFTLSETLERMGPSSVYVKGANAIDPEGNVGILFAAKGAGTIGIVMKEQRKRGFHILIAVGLEKFIPTKIKDCSKAAVMFDISHAHGTPCGVIPLHGTVINEIQAFKLLCGVEAVPVAAGGIAGAEGCLVFMLLGTSSELSKAEELLSQIKGARLPQIYLLDCEVCPRDWCHNSYLYKGKKVRKGDSVE